MTALFEAHQSRSSSKTIATDVLLVAGGSLLMAAATHVTVPFDPVPLTLQTLVAIGLGFALGPKRGGAAILAYIVQGLAGWPVFAGTPMQGAGIAYLLGPTGGFIIGFLVQAVVAGLLAQRGWGRSMLTAMGAGLLSTASIYPTGLLWLGSVIGFDKTLLALGLYPFVLGDLVKALLAGSLLYVSWSVMRGKRK
ncbi:biotin transporter BioY [Mesorhizobium sp. RP14(2022)]|uniref:Biotin transporter n=1 Tax=Mesorhizobium liriopis TaxID=2953882 RepID=A0ABT1C3C8_9HYPH|nr:biotin transporter BioY [Mesorhizobium liriopis]MCO6049338.1 biotin transporter BioY [Mesorhizobium liriopis]